MWETIWIRSNSCIQSKLNSMNLKPNSNYLFNPFNSTCPIQLNPKKSSTNLRNNSNLKESEHYPDYSFILSQAVRPLQI